jgi:hypothetical protein
MRAIDFEAHNDEVRRVWSAYGDGRPTRVPMVLGINPRYTMFGHEANDCGVTFEQYFSDPEVMLSRQLEHQHWVRHHVPQDAEMGLPTDGWEVRVDFQNSYEAGWFGCPIRYFDGEAPDTVPVVEEEARKWELMEKGAPDPFAGGLMQRNWDFYEYFEARRISGFTWDGCPIARVVPAGMGTDGPLTVACNLRGATGIYTDLAVDPDYARQLLQFITEATITRIVAYRRHLGLPARQEGGLPFADDSIQSISSEMYRDTVKLCHQQLIRALAAGRPHAIHLCGDASRHFRMLRDELDIGSFDTGFPIDFGWVRSQLGPDVEIKGGPSVVLLQDASPAQVRVEVQRILASGITDGGRFILREGNNLSPDIGLDKAWAMYDAVRQFGHYEHTGEGRSLVSESHLV